LLFSSNAGPGNATVTHGSVSLVHGTCAYFGPVGAGSFGICTGIVLPPSSPEPRAPRQPPQYFSTSGSTCSGVTSPAMTTVVNCGRYHRSKNVFE
jgi:hypothetical protein